MVKAIVFDLFGTLVNNLSRRFLLKTLGEMAAIVAAPPTEFARQWIGTFACRSVAVDDTVETSIADVSRRCGVTCNHDEVTVAANVWVDFIETAMQPRSGVIAALRDLRAHRLSIGLLSDCSSEVPLLWERTAFAPLVDVAVFSCVAGYRKPHRMLFDSVCERIGVVPADCVYVGDGGSSELKGAADVGMQPIHLKWPGEDTNEVLRFGVERWDGPVVSGWEMLQVYLSELGCFK